MIWTADRAHWLRRGEELVSVSVDSLVIGDVVVVKPDERVAADGFVVLGESSIDQAAITGESVPVDKRPGDEVFAGVKSA